MTANVSYTASGVLALIVPVPSARTEAGGPAAPAAIGSYSTYVTAFHPETNKPIEGFHWDERTWYLDSNENESQYVQTNWDTTVSGVTDSYFQSGIGSGQDLEYDHSELVPSSGIISSTCRRPWLPVVRHGYYYDFNEEHYLFSDDSEVLYTSYVDRVSGVNNSFNKVALLSIPKVGVPVTAERYTWNSSEGKYETDLSVRKVQRFTGVKVSGDLRSSAWSETAEAVIWENVDGTEDEFMVVDSGLVLTLPYALFNRQYNDVYPEGGGYETLGYYTGGGAQEFHTTCSPIDSTVPVDIYSYSNLAGFWSKWPTMSMSGIFQIGVSGVKVDYDYGLVQFPDATVSGTLVPAPGDTVVARYYRALQLEYEPANLGDFRTGLVTNTNPLYRTSGRGFVTLSTRSVEPTAISLSASMPAIQSNLFGPVYIGGASAPIVATVTDIQGLPVEGREVSIFITSDPPAGSFGALGATSTSTSNHLGQAKAYYRPPRSVQEMGEYVTLSGYSQNLASHTTTLHVNNLLLEGTLTDIFLYQVWTNDPAIGYLDVSVAQTALTQQKQYYTSYFRNEDLWGPTGIVGSGVLPIYGSQTSADWEAVHRAAWNLTQLNLFSPIQSNGKKILCATYSSKFLNPHTYTPGAVAPFQPIAANGTFPGYDVVFDTSAYSLPVPSGSAGVTPSGYLYSYFIVAPTTVTLQASVYNASLQQTLYSNEIQVQLRIPPYLSGLWYIDAINSTRLEEISPLLASGIIGSGVPLGFRLKSPNVTLAAALDGVTFLDANPTYNAPIWTTTYSVTPASGVVGSGTYVQHKFNVT